MNIEDSDSGHVEILNLVNPQPNQMNPHDGCSSEQTYDMTADTPVTDSTLDESLAQQEDLPRDAVSTLFV